MFLVKPVGQPPFSVPKNSIMVMSILFLIGYYMMNKFFYIKYFIYSAIFWSFVLTGLTYNDTAEVSYLTSFIAFALCSSLFFPMAVDFIYRIFPTLMKPTTYLGRRVEFIVLIFAVPLGLCWLVQRMIKR